MAAKATKIELTYFDIKKLKTKKAPDRILPNQVSFAYRRSKQNDRTNTRPTISWLAGVLIRMMWLPR